MLSSFCPVQKRNCTFEKQNRQSNSGKNICLFDRISNYYDSIQSLYPIIYHIIDKIKNFTSTRLYENSRYFTIINLCPIIIDTIMTIYA